MLCLALSGLRASSAQRPKVRFQIAFLVRVVLAFLYEWPCPVGWWMTGRALVCHSGVAFLFDLQFCDSIPETGTCPQDNWGVLPQEAAFMVGCPTRLMQQISTFNTCMYLKPVLWNSASKSCTWEWPYCTVKKTPNPTKNQNPNQINPNLKPGTIMVSPNKQWQRWQITEVSFYIIYIHSERTFLERF